MVRAKPKPMGTGMERGASSGGWMGLVAHCAHGGVKKNELSSGFFLMQMLEVQYYYNHYYYYYFLVW